MIKIKIFREVKINLISFIY